MLRKNRKNFPDHHVNMTKEEYCILVGGNEWEKFIQHFSNSHSDQEKENCWGSVLEKSILQKNTFKSFFFCLSKAPAERCFSWWRKFWEIEWVLRVWREEVSHALLSDNKTRKLWISQRKLTQKVSEYDTKLCFPLFFSSYGCIWRC